MVERIRRAGTVCWAVCGVAAVVALLGFIAYVFRVDLAAADPRRRHRLPAQPGRHPPPGAPHPARPRHRRCPTSRWSASPCSSVLLVAPLATRQYDDLAEEWPELRERPRGGRQRPRPSAPRRTSGRSGSPPGRSSRTSSPPRTPPTRTATASSATRRSRTASPSQISTARELALQGVPRRDHLRDRPDHRVLPAGRPAPHPPGVPLAGARAGPRRRDGASPAG